MPADTQNWTPISLASESDFWIGAVHVAPSTRQVADGGRSETVEPRVMQVLVALAGANSAVVSRDELLARCWSGRAVGDNAIHRVIGKVREIGAASGDAFRVETIARVGYRLIPAPADADALVPPARTPAGQPETPVGPARAPSRRSAMALGLGLGAAAVAAAAFALSRRPRIDPRVEALLAQSEHAMNQGLPDSESQGVGFLEEAAALQPDNALIWGRLAQALGVTAEYAAPDQTAALAARTQEAARRALALDARQADALSALALLPPYFGDWTGAEKRMGDVLAIHADHLPTRDALDFLHVAVGRGQEGARSRLTYAGEQTLNAHHQYRLIYACWILDRVGEADRAAERGLQLWPRHPGVWFAHLWTLAFTNRAERALARVEDAAARPDMPPWMIETLRLSMHALTTRARADVDRAVDALFATLARGPSLSVNAILILNGLGELDRAFEVANAYLLDRGELVSSLRWAPGQVSINDQRRRKTNMLFVPASAAMRADPRFHTLTREMGLDAYWRAVGVTPDHLA